MSYKLTKEHVNVRSRFQIIYSSVVVFLISFIINASIVLNFIPAFNLYEKYGSMTLFIIPIISLPFSILRDEYMTVLFDKVENKTIYQYFVNSSKKHNVFQIYYIFLLLMNIIFNIFENIFNLFIYNIMLLTFIIFIIINDSINDVGLYTIVFGEYSNNEDKIIDQNKWLKTICKYIEDTFSDMGIEVLKEDIIFSINKKKMNGEVIDIDDIEKWYLSDNKDNTLLLKLKQIAPDIKISKIKEEKWYDSLQKIPIDHIKFIFLLIMGLYLFIMNPNSVTTLKTIFSQMGG